MKPNKRAIRAWVKALRSGRYKQTRRALRVGDAFCCLGVACDLYSKRKGVGAEERWDGEYIGTQWLSMPYFVSAWLGVPDGDPRVNDVPLSCWNDDKGAGFKKIATLIEKEWL